tara:strand:+ start:1705 stop:2157 length:453 start_codon:yes stop_codon:yes gene_type:complete
MGNRMFELITNPTKKQLSEIKEWMEVESKLSNNEGLFANWTIIERGFKNKELLVITLDNLAIGFNLFSELNKHVIAFDIIEINPNYRFKGFGQKFIVESINYFLEREYYQFIANPINKNSKKLLKKLDFIEVDCIIEYPSYNFSFNAKSI